jgi:uncharacterized RDD family membrane protein YckC
MSDSKNISSGSSEAPASPDNSGTGDLEPAGLGKRFGAVLVDGVLISVFSGILMMVLTQVLLSGIAAGGQGASEGLMGSLLGGTAVLLLLAPMIVFFLYYVILEAHMSSTPGKKVLGMKIVSDDGGDISGVQSLIRNVLRYVDIFPSAYIVGVIAILVSDENKRIGDMVAGTQVVKA